MHVLTESTYELPEHKKYKKYAIHTIKSITRYQNCKRCKILNFIVNVSFGDASFSFSSNNFHFLIDELNESSAAYKTMTYI